MVEADGGVRLGLRAQPLLVLPGGGGAASSLPARRILADVGDLPPGGLLEPPAPDLWPPPMPASLQLATAARRCLLHAWASVQGDPSTGFLCGRTGG